MDAVKAIHATLIQERKDLRDPTLATGAFAFATGGFDGV
jgi:hypothetical protein